MPALLFVDDEESLRETMPPILRMYGFDTTVVASVPEALEQITTKAFDVLLSDLNIGAPGDGFTVVSAMRRVQPQCRTFILTGFPALETALTAIRAQVDDYIVKPAAIPDLIGTIQRGLKEPKKPQEVEGRRLSAILRENVQIIMERTLSNMKGDTRLAALPLSDAERIDHIPEMVLELAFMLDSEHPDRTPPEAMQSAIKRGELRFQQGYSLDMLVTGGRMFVRAVNDVIIEHLLSINMSTLIVDLKWLEESLGLQLEATIRSYLRAERQIAA